MRKNLISAISVIILVSSAASNVFAECDPAYAKYLYADLIGRGMSSEGADFEVRKSCGQARRSTVTRTNSAGYAASQRQVSQQNTYQTTVIIQQRTPFSAREQEYLSREQAITAQYWQDVRFREQDYRYREATLPADVATRYVGAALTTALAVAVGMELFDDDDHRHWGGHHGRHGGSYYGGHGRY